MTDATATLPRKPRGPQPKGFVQVTLLIPPELVQWGKGQDSGLASLVRRLLREEYERQRAQD